MKFAKSLTSDAVPEWRAKYLDYRALKKLLSAISISLDDPTLPSQPHSHQLTPQIPMPLPPLLSATSLDALAPLSVQHQQLPPEPLSHPRVARINYELELEVNETPLSSLPPSASSSSAFTRLPGLDTSENRRPSLFAAFSSPRRSRAPSLVEPRVPLDEHLLSRTNQERDFFEFLDSEVKKVGSFYSELLVKYVDTLVRLKHQGAMYLSERKSAAAAAADAIVSATSSSDSRASQSSLRIRKLLKKITNPSSDGSPKSASTSLTTLNTLNASPTHASGSPSTGLTTATSASGINHHGNASCSPGLLKKNVLRDAMLEFYRGLSLLRNYQVMNHTAVVKILKKFDKTAQWASSRLYTTSRDPILRWQQDKTISGMFAEIESLFGHCFAGSNRQLAMRQLRVPDKSKHTYIAESKASGFFFGVGVTLIIFTVTAMSEDIVGTPRYVPLLQIFGGLLMPILFSVLFSYILVLWSANAINYVFVFGFDTRDHIHHTQFLNIAAFFFLLWSIFLFLTFSPAAENSLLTSLGRHHLPAIFFFLVMAIFVMPFPVFYPSARRWLLRTLWSILTSPIHKIQFKDFFVTDIFTSMIFSLSSLPLFTCVSIRGQEKCDTSLSLSTLAFALVPHSTRLVQCFRRYHDTGNMHPHLSNAVKYISSLLVIITSYFWRRTENELLLATWITTAVVSTIYSIYWDTKEDWGLLHLKHKMLRAELSFSPPLIYYLAVLLNIFFRSTWTLQVSPGTWVPEWYRFWITLVCATIETIRRAQWCIFRMENEHLTNCGMFRAVKDIPVPHPDEHDEHRNA